MNATGIRKRISVALLAVALGAAACDDSSAPEMRAPARIEVDAGNGQTGPVGEALSQPLVVQVFDANGRPLPNATVSWRVTAGGGNVEPTSTETDATGVARTMWTLGGALGVHTTQAVAGSRQALFHAKGVPGLPAALLIGRGEVQRGFANWRAPEFLSVRVLDRFGNGIPGVALLWSTAGGRGSVLPLDSVSIVEGTGRAVWILGGITGEDTAFASVADLTPAVFVATVEPQPPAELQVVQGDGQRGSVGEALALSLAVRVLDLSGAPFPDTVIVWSALGDTTARFQPTFSRTDSAGVAQTSWVLGTKAGAQMARASVPGSPLVTAFIAQADPGPVARIDVAPDSVSLWAGDTVRLRTTAFADRYGNPLPDRPVTWRSSDPMVARVDAEGLVTGTGDGVVAIIAAADGGEGAAGIRSTTPDFVQVSTSYWHACALHRDGRAFCWGEGTAGKIGIPPGSSLSQSCAFFPSFRCFVRPVLVSSALRFQSISAAFGYTCASGATGIGYCWGNNYGGVLGNPTVDRIPTPTPVVSDAAFVDIRGANTHTCAISTSSDVYCWGAGTRGELGTGDYQSSDIPIPVPTGLRFGTLTTGVDFTCGLTEGGVAYCWGRNDEGQAGIGTTNIPSDPNNPGVPAPAPVSTEERFVTLRASYGTACAARADGAAFCWGQNRGHFGNDTTSGSTTPTPAAVGLSLKTIDPGRQAACGISLDDDAFCWGYISGGSLQPPALVPGGLRWRALDMDDAYTCGISAAGQLYCWGSNLYARLGDGTFNSRTVPTRVAAPYYSAGN